MKIEDIFGLEGNEIYINTKKYEEYTGKKASTAYAQIRNFLKKHEFQHRQSSGYVSKGYNSQLLI